MHCWFHLRRHIWADRRTVLIGRVSAFDCVRCGWVRYVLDPRATPPIGKQEDPTMPMYLDKPVSDDDLQALIQAYRTGMRMMGAEPDENDQVIIDRLEYYGVVKPEGADAVARVDAGE